MGWNWNPSRIRGFLAQMTPLLGLEDGGSEKMEVADD